MNRLLMLLLLGMSLTLSACQKKEGATPPISGSEGVQKETMEINVANDDQEMQVIISAAKARVDQQLQSQEPEKESETQKLDYPLDNI